MIGMGADTSIENNKKEKVEIADTLQQYFKHTKYAMQLDSANDDWDLKDISIIEPPSEVSPKPLSGVSPKSEQNSSLEFPSEISVEDIPKPNLVDSNKEESVQKFIGNLLKSKKLN